MGRFGQSVVYGGLFTFWIMCFYFGFSVLSTAFKGGDVVAVAGQSVLVGFVLWFFLSFVFYDLQGWIEERNKPREADDRRSSSDPDSPENQRGRHIDGL
ncbi:MAG: hypothetical protein EKK48_16835 [Candidatus Melainabacteria bacterium]|nr:MAG: hypothetical protein EKK48_16835 [Candidatus Melainabacteria bacterium]